jgi:hypothetical protein
MSPTGLPLLPPGATLAVWRRSAEDAAPIFQSGAKWLHPLFELTDFLAGRPDLDPAGLVLRDHIVGRAAAFLILRLGITEASAELASRPAHVLFAARGLVLAADRTVERIDCRTEELLAGVEGEAAWNLLLERRRAALARG